MMSKGFSDSGTVLKSQSAANNEMGKSKQSLQAVYLNSHRNKAPHTPYKCALCDKAFTQSSSLRRHMDIGTHNYKSPFKCTVCDKVFVSRFNLARHTRTYTKKTSYRCNVCNKGLKDVSHLTRHMRMHMKQTPYKCSVCDTAFTTNSKLTAHKMTHIKCTMCDKAFNKSSSLTVHMRRHTKETSYKIKQELIEESMSNDIADLVAVSKSPLAVSNKTNKSKQSIHVVHMRPHRNTDPETPYKCALCDHAFTQSNSLKRHMDMGFHIYRTPFKCTVCAKAFVSSLSLTRHTAAYTINKCTICDKTFDCRSSLTTHMRYHTKETPYKCTECDKAFALNGSLTIHMRTHTGEKPFSCVWCARRFATSSNQNKHMSVCNVNMQQHASEPPEQNKLAEETSSTNVLGACKTYDFAVIKEESII